MSNEEALSTSAVQSCYAVIVTSHGKTRDMVPALQQRESGAGRQIRRIMPAEAATVSSNHKLAIHSEVLGPIPILLLSEGNSIMTSAGWGWGWEDSVKNVDRATLQARTSP